MTRLWRACAQIVARRGVLQQVNIMVCTYNEPVETVKLCVEHLLAAEAPVYCKKVVYIGDDGAKKKFQCSEDKRVMCEEFHRRAPPPLCSASCAAVGGRTSGYCSGVCSGARPAVPLLLRKSRMMLSFTVIWAH